MKVINKPVVSAMQNVSDTHFIEILVPILSNYVVPRCSIEETSVKSKE
jgi:hypothetical protein